MAKSQRNESKTNLINQHCFNMEKEEKKTFEQECEGNYFEFDPNRNFDERCEILRRTAITREMTYEERLAMQRARYGL